MCSYGDERDGGGGWGGGEGRVGMINFLLMIILSFTLNQWALKRAGI